MILKNAKAVYFGSSQIKKAYFRGKLVYSYITPPPPIVAEENMSGSTSADNYTSGSTEWGDLTLSSGCTVSKDGIEFQNEETYVSASISGLSYPMTFEFKGRADSACYKTQANGPGMIFGMGPVQDNWGDGITCYTTSDYGIIIDTTGAMTIVTNATPTYIHIILVINESGTLTMYLNGINNTWSASSNSAITSNKNYIYNGEGIGRFIGAINTMRWWNIALSTDEITQLFASDSSEYVL